MNVREGLTLDLSSCQGYTVETGGCTMGVVVAARPRGERADQGLLIVHSRMASCGLAVVSSDQIAAVDHQRKRLRLRGGSATT